MSQFLYSPRSTHMQVVHHLLHYLKGKLDIGLYFLPILPFKYGHFQMQIRQLVQIPNAPLLVFEPSLGTLSFPRSPRNNIIYLVHLLRQNIRLWQLHLVRLLGSTTSLRFSNSITWPILAFCDNYVCLLTDSKVF